MIRIIILAPEERLFVLCANKVRGILIVMSMVSVLLYEILQDLFWVRVAKSIVERLQSSIEIDLFHTSANANKLLVAKNHNNFG